MAKAKLDVETYFGRCKCCLTYGYLRPLWEENEDNEVYGKIISELFTIPWKEVEDDKICEDCISKLQDARKFKQQILESEAEMHGTSTNLLNEDQIKCEPDEMYDVEYLDEEILHKYSEGEEEESELYEIDYLDDDENDLHYEVKNELVGFNDEEKPEIRKRVRRTERVEESDSDSPKLKWPKKLPKEERLKTYKQYTEGDMKSAQEAVLLQAMSQKAAAIKYRVPHKTLSARIRDIKGKEEFINKSEPATIFAGEMRALLHYFNITPFRNRASISICFFCRKKEEFEKPEDLRVHTRTAHPDPTKLVEMALRPTWNNELIKIDINEAKCKKCHQDFYSWEQIIDHLEEHGITLENKHRLVPFSLGANKCVLCPQTFSSFSLLDTHMNKHFPNYVCDNCGDPFATVSRLRAHEKTHSTQNFPCSICNKVFTLHKYMRKHITLKHMKIAKSKCSYCNEVFMSDYSRQAHIAKEHKDKINHITCDICGETFDWMRNYVRHMKRKHDTEFCCKICRKTFASSEVLNKHNIIHKGNMFMCPLCRKEYSTYNTLKSHVRFSHTNFPEKVKAVFGIL